MGGSRCNNLFAKLSLEIFETIFIQEVEWINRTISQVTDLPQNGQARSNRYLASLLMLNNSNYLLLKHLTWKMLSIDYTGKKLDHTVLYKAQEISKKYQLNKQCIRVINVRLVSPTVEDSTEAAEVWLKTTIPLDLIRLATSMFERAPADSIRECIICLDLVSRRLCANDQDTLSQEVLWTEARLLLLTIQTFKNLTTFKFLTAEKSHIAESFLAEIINHLPNLHTIVLCGFDIGDVNEQLENSSDLGSALASRASLKFLSIRYLKTFTTCWLDLQWQGQLQELTVEPIILPSNSAFPYEDLLRFCHLFHRTLLVLELGNSPSRYDHTAINMAQDFVSLMHLTFQGVPQFINAFSLCPNIQSLTWLNGYPELLFTLNNDWVRLKTVIFPQSYFEDPTGATTISTILTSRYQIEFVDCNMSLGSQDAWTDLKSWLNYKPTVV